MSFTNNRFFFLSLGAMTIGAFYFIFLPKPISEAQKEVEMYMKEHGPKHHEIIFSEIRDQGYLFYVKIPGRFEEDVSVSLVFRDAATGKISVLNKPPNSKPLTVH